MHYEVTERKSKFSLIWVSSSGQSKPLFANEQGTICKNNCATCPVPMRLLSRPWKSIHFLFLSFFSLNVFTTIWRGTIRYKVLSFRLYDKRLRSHLTGKTLKTVGSEDMEWEVGSSWKNANPFKKELSCSNKQKYIYCRYLRPLKASQRLAKGV